MTMTNYPLHKKFTLIIDFDSTFTQVEALDILADITLRNDPEKNKKVAAIIKDTQQGMNGDTPFQQSLVNRLKLLSANKRHLPDLIHELQKKVSVSIAENLDFFQRFSHQVLIVSSGFKEFIIPVVNQYNIPDNQVYANTFLYDTHNNIIGFNTKNLLSQNQGKVALIKSLKLTHPVFVVGDGFTDYEIRQAGLADAFFAFTENVFRNKVTERADFVVNHFDQVLTQLFKL